VLGAPLQRPSTAAYVTLITLRCFVHDRVAMFHRLKEFYFEALFRFKRVCLCVLGSLLFISAALMLLGGALVYRASSGWPQTPGQLLKFDVQPLKRHSSHLKIEVAFTYSVGGKDFQGQYFSPLTRPGKILRWVGRQKQSEYRVGDRVKVIYDPSDPAQAYLEAPHLFWDIALVPVSIGCLGAWLLFLFIKTRRRTVPPAVAAQRESRFANRNKWRPIMESVIEQDHLVLRGFTAYSATGSLLSGWPSCRVALVASPNEIAVVPGPFTKRGLASSALTLILELSLSRFWLPAIHGMFFLFEMLRRGRHWRMIRDQRFTELVEDSEHIRLVSIDEAVVYGYDPTKRRLWYRLPGQKMDEFIRLSEADEDQADQLIAYIGLMQNAVLED